MENKTARVINKSGTTKLADNIVAEHAARQSYSNRNRRRDNRRNRRAMDQKKREYDSINISINRVSRTVKGGRRMRFQALVAIGNHKDKVGVAMAKGVDVTSAVQKAESRAKKNLLTLNINGETIWHEVETKVTGAKLLMKPAAPGTGIIAGGVVRSIIGLTGIKNLISKSLGSNNKANIAYAVLEGLRAQVPRENWVAYKYGDKTMQKASSTEKTQVEKAKPTTSAAAHAQAKSPVTAKVATKAASTKAKTEPAPKTKATTTVKAAPKAKAAKATPKAKTTKAAPKTKATKAKAAPKAKASVAKSSATVKTSPVKTKKSEKK